MLCQFSVHCFCSSQSTLYYLFWASGGWLLKHFSFVASAALMLQSCSLSTVGAEGILAGRCFYSCLNCASILVFFMVILKSWQWVSDVHGAFSPLLCSRPHSWPSDLAVDLTVGPPTCSQHTPGLMPSWCMGSFLLVDQLWPECPSHLLHHPVGCKTTPSFRRSDSQQPPTSFRICPSLGIVVTLWVLLQLQSFCVSSFMILISHFHCYIFCVASLCWWDSEKIRCFLSLFGGG